MTAAPNACEAATAATAFARSSPGTAARRWLRAEWIGFAATLAIACGSYLYLQTPATAVTLAAASVPPAMPVSVASVHERRISGWDECSGRLEAEVEHVDPRTRVSGTTEALNFAPGSAVTKASR